MIINLSEFLKSLSMALPIMQTSSNSGKSYDPGEPLR